MSQTFEDIRQAALARLAEFTSTYPLGTQVPFRRIGVRQQQLYALAAHENPEYGGECAIGTVDAGAVDLTSIAPPIAAPERITKILVYALAAGASAFRVGDQVTIVPVGDPDGVPPRAYLRHKTLIGVDGELDTIASVQIFYPYRPDPADADEDGLRVIEVPDPHSELLVVDLARDYLRKMLQLDARADIIALFDKEEVGMLDSWLKHVREYAPIESRFAIPPAAPVARTRRPDA